MKLTDTIKELEEVKAEKIKLDQNFIDAEILICELRTKLDDKYGNKGLLKEVLNKNTGLEKSGLMTTIDNMMADITPEQWVDYHNKNIKDEFKNIDDNLSI